MQSSLKKHKSELKKASEHLSENDKVLKKLILASGECGIRPHKGYFETLVHSIASQQLSVKAASSIFGRFKKIYDENGIRFPQPEEIMKTSDERIRESGFSGPKVNYV